MSSGADTRASYRWSRCATGGREPRVQGWRTGSNPMGIQRTAGISGSMRGVPALVVTVLGLAALAGTCPAAAAGHPGGAAAPGAGHATAAGLISTVAGGAGGPAKARDVALGGLCGVSFGAGRAYFADSWAVREMNPQTTWLTTPAGTGAGPGTLGDGGPASKATVWSCGRVAVDHSGNLVIGDQANNRVRAVAARTGTFYGQHMTAGDIYTVAGDGTPGFSGDGGPATSAELNEPRGVAVDHSGNLVFADAGNGRVRVVAVKTGTFYGQHMTAGNIYTVAGGGTHRLGTGGPATAARVTPMDVAVDAAGNLVIADTLNNRIRVVAVKTGTFYGQAMTAGHIYNVAGDGRGRVNDGGPATSAALLSPEAVTVDAAGNLVIADTDHNRIRVVAVKTGTFYGRAMTAGDIYVVAGDGQRYSGDGGPATRAELNIGFSYFVANGVLVDHSGNLVFADDGSDRIRMVPASTGTFYGISMKARHVYYVAGGGQSNPGDGGPATNAQLYFPAGVAVDAAGNLLIADWGHQRIRVVAAKTGTFYGQAMTTGDIYTVAGNGGYGYSGDGGPATGAELANPEGVAVDAAGNLVIADTVNNRVRVVAAKTGTFYGQAMTAGDIYTVAGDGTPGFGGDGGPATSAELGPTGLAVGAAGNMVLADTENQRIRVVAVKTGTFYGQAMTAGDIYTIAGNGTAGFND